MIILIALIAGMVIGALGMAALNGRRPDIRHGLLPCFSGRLRPEDTAAGRDLGENAGGSRHIRTNPSWRNRLE
ncbi:hypothetical protein GFY24_40305 [Nocardia sp. SYP-A9097]|uniref:hypothetical protein n=1 Tax=Nocardia sp. SYP-A9097 TaxID=2663237 RepID=UPI00129A96A6|nr:hypothetical protein [Nocardia sp. SYP-A9097]MRH93568.1 hypothetical protein [Nocardia sp. SYP-A9097]